MGKVLEFRDGPERRTPEGCWSISVGGWETRSFVELVNRRTGPCILIHANTLRELPALMEQGRKLLARGNAVDRAAAPRIYRPLL